MKRFPALLCVLWLAGCAASVVAPPVTPAMAAQSGRSSALLETGRRLYGARCGGCHALEPPGRHGAEEWRRLVDEMSGRAKLTGSEHEAVLAYLLAARDAPPAR